MRFCSRGRLFGRRCLGARAFGLGGGHFLGRRLVERADVAAGGRDLGAVENLPPEAMPDVELPSEAANA